LSEIESRRKTQIRAIFLRLRHGQSNQVISLKWQWPRRVFEELANIKAVDVVLPIRSGGHIRRRCVSQPSNHQAILLQRLGLNLPKNLPLAEKILKTM